MNIANKSIINILAQSGGTILLLLSSIVFVRYFSKQDYGTFLQVMLIVNTAIVLTFMGIPNSIYYFYQHEERKDLFLLQSITLSIVVAVVGASIVYLGQGILVRLLNNPDLGQYGGMMALLIMLNAPLKLREPFLWSHGSLILCAYLSVVSNILHFGLPIIGAMLGASLMQLMKLMIYASLLDIVLHAVIFAWVLRDLRGRLDASQPAATTQSWTLGSLWKQINYSIPLAISSYFGVLGKELDKYIVAYWFLAADFAVFTRGAIQVPILSTMHFTVNDILMPDFVRLYKEGNIPGFLELWHASIDKLAKVNFAAAALLFVLAPQLITVLYTEAYRDASDVFRVFLFLLLLGIIVHGMIPRVSGHTRPILIATIITLIMSFGLSLFLLRFFGPLGPAIATVISSLVASFWLLLNSCRIIDVPLRRILPWRRIGRILNIACVSTLPIVLVETFSRLTGVSAIVLLGVETICYCYIYLSLLNKANLLTVMDFEVVQGWIRMDPKRLLFNFQKQGSDT